MRHRSIRQAQVLTFMVVLVVATGMTAAPVRNALTPLISHPLGGWIGHAPTAASGVTMTGQSAATATRDIELDVQMGAPLAYSAGGGHSAADHLARAESEGQSSARDEGGSRRSGRLNDRFTELRQNRYGASSFAFNRDVGSRVGAGTTGRDEGSSRSTPSRSGSSAPGNSAGGGGGSSPDPKKGENAKDPQGLFNEHKSGLPDLDGHKGPKDTPPGKGIGKAGKVAVNPEPSTLFLFGTGMAFVAGAIRRRLS